MAVSSTQPAIASSADVVELNYAVDIDYRQIRLNGECNLRLLVDCFRRRGVD
jgi:hypothetical protein